jgi:hypothetical protein
MTKKTILLLALTLFSARGIMSQNIDINNVKAVVLKNVDAIIENDEVKGYLTFYMVERKNIKENVYKLVIYDNNLNQKYDIDLTKSTTTHLMESAYNGTTFCYSFLDLRTKSISYSIYDKEGKLTGTNTTTKLSRMEMMGLQQKTQAESNEFYGGLIAISGKGFARYNLDDKGKSAVVSMIDNNAAEVWTSPINGDDDNDYVTAVPIAANKNLIVSQVYTRESMMTQNIKKWFLTFQKSEDGSEAFKLNCKGDKHLWSVNGVTFEGDNIYVYGEYFKPGVNPFKSESDGIFFLKMDQAGNILEESYSSWTKDINRAVPNAMTSENGKRNKMAIHKIIRTNDGKFFAICEQFKITADAMGIVSNAINSDYGSSMTKMVVMNMVVLEFDANMKITDGQVITKNNNSVTYKAGLEFYGTAMIVYYLKSTGRFDYDFTTVSPDRSTFNATYTNYDKEKDGKIKIVGNIAYNRDKKIVKDVINIDDKPTAFMALAGKPGYVGIVEYYKKIKKLNFRLEKLNL